MAAAEASVSVEVAKSLGFSDADASSLVDAFKKCDADGSGYVDNAEVCSPYGALVVSGVFRWRSCGCCRAGGERAQLWKESDQRYARLAFLLLHRLSLS
jgi:hypothetical protein